MSARGSEFKPIDVLAMLACSILALPFVLVMAAPFLGGL